MPYEVLVNDLTVNRDGAPITDLFGNVLGFQTESSIFQKGDVLEDDQVAESLRDSVDNGDTEGYLKKVGNAELEASREAQEPFPGYSDMDVEQIQTLLKFLPSEAVRSVVEFEINHGDNRPGIADWHIGRGEAFTDRLTGRAGSPGQEKAVDKEDLQAIVTRDVGEDDFTFGESLSDDGQPQVDFGSKEGDDTPEGERVTQADEGASTPSRRGRRASKAAAKAAPKPAADNDKKDDSGS